MSHLPADNPQGLAEAAPLHAALAPGVVQPVAVAVPVVSLESERARHSPTALMLTVLIACVAVPRSRVTARKPEVAMSVVMFDALTFC